MSEGGEAGSIKPSVEIVRNGNFDVLLNAHHPDQQKVKHLAEVFKNGLPQNWAPFDTRSLEDDDAPISTYVDQTDGPSFFCKVRQKVNPIRLKQVQSGEEDGNIRALNAYHSLVNEIALAEEVKRVLDMPEAKEVVKSYGFEDVTFIEPLVGINDRENERKLMVYDFVTGDRGFEKPEPGKTNKMHELHFTENINHTDYLSDEMGLKLRAVFRAQGIEAEDLEGHQFFSSKDDGTGKFKLYLYDIEGYYKI